MLAGRTLARHSHLCAAVPGHGRYQSLRLAVHTVHGMRAGGISTRHDLQMIRQLSGQDHASASGDILSKV